MAELSLISALSLKTTQNGERNEAVLALKSKNNNIILHWYEHYFKLVRCHYYRRYANILNRWTSSMYESATEFSYFGEQPTFWKLEKHRLVSNFAKKQSLPFSVSWDLDPLSWSRTFSGLISSLLPRWQGDFAEARKKSLDSIDSWQLLFLTREGFVNPYLSVFFFLGEKCLSFVWFLWYYGLVDRKSQLVKVFAEIFRWFGVILKLIRQFLHLSIWWYFLVSVTIVAFDRISRFYGQRL